MKNEDQWVAVSQLNHNGNLIPTESYLLQLLLYLHCMFYQCNSTSTWFHCHCIRWGWSSRLCWGWHNACWCLLSHLQSSSLLSHMPIYWKQEQILKKFRSSHFHKKNFSFPEYHCYNNKSGWSKVFIMWHLKHIINCQYALST